MVGTNRIIIGNIIALIASIFMVATGFLKDKRRTLISQNIVYVIMSFISNY